MKTKLCLLTLALLLLGIAGCAAPTAPPLDLSGDAEPFVFTGRSYDLAYYFEHRIETRAEEFDLLIIGHDGFTARISGDSLDGCALVYDNGWHLQSAYHPPSANVRDITQIVVISTSDDPYAIRLVDAEEQVQTLTAGQMHLLDTHRVLNEEGTNRLNNRSVTVYTTRQLVSLPLAGDSFVAMSRSGETMFFRGAAYLTGGTHISLQLSDGRLLHDLVGVMAEPPGFLITEAFHDAVRFLEQGERVLLIKLDGLGWNMLDAAPFIASLEPHRALAVYPPVTPTGLAAMLTGATPDQSGIGGRGERELIVPDIFEVVEQLNKTSIHIGARNSFINTSLSPQLTLSDADAFELAMQHLDTDLLFIHFKGIDVAAHYYGPHADATRQVIAEIDDFVRVLMESFEGRVIITADHGLHETEAGGNHGLFLPEDMIVPYIIR